MQEVAHRSVPARLRPWLALLAAGAACAGITEAGEAAARAFRYERDLLLDGEVWRALTCHFVHTSWLILGMDAAVAALLVAVYGRHLRPLAVLLCAAGTSAGLFLFALRTKDFVGPSGLLLGLAVFGAAEAGRRDWVRWFPLFPMALLIIGVDFVRELRGLFEVPQVSGIAYAAGAASGLIAFAVLYRRVR